MADTQRRHFVGALAGAGGAVVVSVVAPGGAAAATAVPAATGPAAASSTFNNLNVTNDLTVGESISASALDLTQGGTTSGTLLGSTALFTEGIEPRDAASLSFDITNGVVVTGPTRYDSATGDTTGFGTALHVEANSGPGNAVTISAQQGQALTVTQQAGTHAAITVGNSGTGPGLYVANQSRHNANYALVATNTGTGSGARFTGTRSQINLAPGTHPGHPAQGQMGDLFCDSQGSLWFCKGAAHWAKIA